MVHFAIRDLTFSYPTADRPALDAINLSIRAGEYVTLCGRSGCGKTTLLRHLKTPLTPHGARTGVIEFEGVPLEEVSAIDQSAKIGFVMQNPDSQIVTDKVWHELAFGLESLGFDQRTMRLRVAEMASYFGIQHWFHRETRELSGGQKQLLNLASIMAMQPSALILDEPTSQLDPIAASDFLNTVRKINIELGTTVILTEHRLESVWSASDRVIVMKEGRILCDGDPRSVGDELYERGDDMLPALPAPMRIYYGVKTADRIREGASDATAGEVPEAPGASRVPMTVREGRQWLAERCRRRPPRKTRLAEDRTYEPARDDVCVDVRDVWFRYGRDLPDVVKGASFTVGAGTLFALVGGNGTGKSTTLKLIDGVERPYRGSIRVLGRKLSSYRGAALHRHALAMLPQDPQNVFVKDTVRDDLREMLDDEPMDAASRERRIEEIAALTEIAPLLDAHPFDLSGGEQQRAALAKVLLTDPRVLLLDEPTKGLDNFFKQTLAGIFDELKARGVTIIMVTHDVEFCAAHADAVSMFFDGSIVTTNTPRRFFSYNSFYTTAANRMSRQVFQDAITDGDVIALCES